MTVAVRSEVHEMGLRLAEEGRHAEGLEMIRRHLGQYPGDYQALNDAGVILFVMGSNEEAIEHLERAKGRCPKGQTGEINWNLCEAYLAAGYPGPAMGLFDEMERQEILNPDLLNRAANAFLGQEMYGHAIESLLRSLAMSPGQEILKPMIEVIWARRPRVGVFAGERNEEAGRLYELVGQRFAATLHTGAGAGELERLIRECDIAIFDGWQDGLAEALRTAGACRVLVRLSDEEVYGGAIERVCLRNVASVIVSDNPAVRERLRELWGERGEGVKVVASGRGVDTRRYAFAEKGRGKRIACVDRLTAKNNPMFLLQCMQKLNYIDKDYRLYLAGGFEDGATEDYVRYMVEEMRLSDVVFFDSGVRNEATWLRDKHYVVTAATTAEGLGGVLKGMSCGLRPVVHNFPGAREMFEGEFLFNISEEFCAAVASGGYEPRRYREIVESRYSEAVRFKVINDVLFGVEQGIVREQGAAREEAVREGALQGAVDMPIAGELVRLEAVGGEAGEEDSPGAGGQNATEYLCGRVGSINQVSADVLRDWKAFAERCGGAACEEVLEQGDEVETASPCGDGLAREVKLKQVPFV